MGTLLTHLDFALGWLTNDWMALYILNSGGLHKVCYLGRAPSSPNSFTLGWLTRGLHRWNSTSSWFNYLPAADKRSATLAPLNFTLGYSHTTSATCYLPPLNFTLGWLTKGMHRWNGTFVLKIIPLGGSQRVYIGFRLTYCHAGI